MTNFKKVFFAQAFADTEKYFNADIRAYEDEYGVLIEKTSYHLKG